VNFSDEVTAAFRLCDGVVIFVDAAEGVSLQHGYVMLFDKPGTRHANVSLHRTDNSMLKQCIKKSLHVLSDVLSSLIFLC
jgi:U5 small nuclear ribonucleoprotein component